MKQLGGFRYNRRWWSVWLCSQAELRGELRGKPRYVYHGCCDAETRRILLYDRLGENQLRLAFYHELIEMVNSERSLGLGHSVIEALGDDLGRLLTFELEASPH